MQTTLKKTNTLPSISRQVLFNNSVFSYADPIWRVLWSAKDSSGGAIQFYRRDITDYTRANGTPDQGVVVMPIYSGASLPGARSAVVTVPGGGGSAVVTFAAGPAGTLTQRIYSTKADTPGGSLFFVAEISNGDAAGGFAVTVPDSEMISVAQADDESATAGNLVGLGTPSTPAAVADAALGMTVGDHEFAIVNVALSDTAVEKMLLYEIIFVDNELLRDRSWPENGFEEWLVTPNIS